MASKSTIYCMHCFIERHSTVSVLQFKLYGECFPYSRIDIYSKRQFSQGMLEWIDRWILYMVLPDNMLYGMSYSVQTNPLHP